MISSWAEQLQLLEKRDNSEHFVNNGINSSGQKQGKRLSHFLHSLYHYHHCCCFCCRIDQHHQISAVEASAMLEERNVCKYRQKFTQKVEKVERKKVAKLERIDSANIQTDLSLSLLLSPSLEKRSFIGFNSARGKDKIEI